MNFSSLGLEKNGYDKSKPIVTNCNVGLTAAFLSYAIEDAVKNIPRLYNVRMFFKFKHKNVSIAGISKRIGTACAKDHFWWEHAPSSLDLASSLLFSIVIRNKSIQFQLELSCLLNIMNNKANEWVTILILPFIYCHL